MTPAILISAIVLELTVLGAVVGVVWRLSTTLKDLALAISGLETEIKQNTMDERERTDRKIKEAIDSCRAAESNRRIPISA